MIRITSIYGDTGQVSHIAGNLQAQHLAELEQVCSDRAAPLVVDLSELQSADADGVRWLTGASDDGARIIGASPYIALLIDRAKQEANRGRAIPAISIRTR